MPGIAAHARRGRLTAAAAGVLVLAGVLLLVVGLRAQRQPPQPPAAAAIPYASSQPSSSQPGPSQPSSSQPGPSQLSSSQPGASQRSSSQRSSSQPVVQPPPRTGASGSPSTAKPATGLVLGRSAPIRLEVPQLDISSDLLQLGLNADQSLQVPPLGKNSPAGWYKYSPTPGQLGPSVLLGHVDSAEYGPGVFFKLGALRPGSTVRVTRADRTAAVFRVDRVVSYSKDNFPTLEVYGNTDSAQLRLITCGGEFDPDSGHYESNIVAFATLVSSHPA